LVRRADTAATTTPYTTTAIPTTVATTSSACGLVALVVSVPSSSSSSCSFCSFFPPRYGISFDFVLKVKVALTARAVITLGCTLDNTKYLEYLPCFELASAPATRQERQAVPKHSQGSYFSGGFVIHRWKGRGVVQHQELKQNIMIP
jgi:hypothetical protein